MTLPSRVAWRAARRPACNVCTAISSEYPDDSSLISVFRQIQHNRTLYYKKGTEYFNQMRKRRSDGMVHENQASALHATGQGAWEWRKSMNPGRVLLSLLFPAVKQPLLLRGKNQLLTLAETAASDDEHHDDRA
jgi:hypothetical protein